MREHWKSRAAVPAVAGLLLLLQAALLPAGAVWVTDNGNKFIILENLLRNGSAAIAYPAAEIDPGRRFFPDGNFHFQRHCGRIVSIYPEFFSALALPGYRLFGAVGLWLLPVGGTLGGPCAVSRAAAEIWAGLETRGGTGRLLLCGSPLLFYSGTFWEMTAATAFPLAALLAARRRRLLAAGLLLGLGLWLREEFYLIALAAGIAALFFYPKEWRRCVPFGAGFLLAAIPLWIYNLVNYGHILGLHGALYYTHNAEGVPTLAEPDRRGVRGILSVFVPIRIRLARRGDRLDSACADVPAAGGRCGQVGAHQALGRLDRGGRLGVSVLEILVQSVPGSGVGSYRRLRDLFPAACRVFPHVAESADPRAAAAADGHAGRIALLSGAAGGADPQRHRADLGGAALSAGLSAAVCPELRRFCPARMAAEAAGC